MRVFNILLWDRTDSPPQPPQPPHPPPHLLRRSPPPGSPNVWCQIIDMHGEQSLASMGHIMRTLRYFCQHFLVLRSGTRVKLVTNALHTLGNLPSSQSPFRVALWCISALCFTLGTICNHHKALLGLHIDTVAPCALHILSNLSPQSFLRVAHWYSSALCFTLGAICNHHKAL